MVCEYAIMTESQTDCKLFSLNFRTCVHKLFENFGRISNILCFENAVEELLRY
jgi:hypothetical protein